jgi:hypothetical protein
MRFALHLATLLVALPALVGALGAAASVASAETPAPAGARSAYGFTQRELDELADRASKAVARCDVPEGGRLIALMRRTADSLRTAAVPPLGTREMLRDALRLFEVARSLAEELRRCDRPHMAASINAGESYGFFTQAAAEALEGYMKDAAAAAQNCREDLYDKAIADLRSFADALYRAADQNAERAEQYRKDAANLRRAANDLADPKTRAARFAHCKKDERTAAPDTTPGGAGPREPPPVPPEPRAPAPPREVGAAPRTEGPDLFSTMVWATFAAHAFYAEVGFGLGPAHFGEDSPSYVSTGSQPPFFGAGRGRSTAALCGELALWYTLFWTMHPDAAAAIVVSAPHLGVALSMCGLTGTRVTLFDIARHGPGTVRYELNERFTYTLLFQARLVLWLQLDAIFRQFYVAETAQLAAAGEAAQVTPGPRRTWWPVMITAGIGPSFVRSKVTLTSDQSFFGGGVPSASDSRTETGFTFRIGASTPLCRSCVFGNPLMAGVDGTFTWLPSREISLRSPAFGFTETARLGARTNTSVIFKVSVPIGLGRF